MKYGTKAMMMLMLLTMRETTMKISKVKSKNSTVIDDVDDGDEHLVSGASMRWVLT